MSLFGRSQRLFAIVELNKIGVPGHKVNRWLADVIGGGGIFFFETAGKSAARDPLPGL